MSKEEAHSPDEVQRLYIVLRPESGERSVEEKQDPLSSKEGSKKKPSSDHDFPKTATSSSNEGRHGSQVISTFLDTSLLNIITKKNRTQPKAKRVFLIL